MSDITEFLLARIDEDEAHASSGWARLGDSRWETTNEGQDFLTPSAVLAECAAKRAIIKWVNRWPLRPHAPSSVDGVLEMLASAYADHDDYREEWKTLTERG